MNSQIVTHSILHGDESEILDDNEEEQDYSAAPLIREGANKAPIPLNLQRILKVFHDIKIVAFSVFLTFAVTIGIFPSLIVLFTSVNRCKRNARAFNDLFIPFLFVIFNLFDFVGRITAGKTGVRFTKNTIWIASSARLIFFPLFLLCNVDGTHLPVVFNSDAFPIIFMTIFAFTNGYVASTCMMMGPPMVATENMGLAGTMMVFFLTFGLLAGASISFLTVYISQGSI